MLQQYKELYKNLKHTFKIRDILKKNNPKVFSSKQKMPWNIYETGEVLNRHMKKFHVFHYIIKYKIILPILLIIEWLMDKKVKIKYDDVWYNKNIKIFDEVFDDSLKTWNYSFRANTPRNNPKRLKSIGKIRRNFDTNISNRSLKVIKKLTMRMYLLDTAYREFINIFMFKISQRMQKEYAKKHYHLFYTSNNIQDVEYLALGSIINNSSETIIYKVDNRGKKQKVKFNLNTMLGGAK
jgi:hypothetical protein